MINRPPTPAELSEAVATQKETSEVVEQTVYALLQVLDTLRRTSDILGSLAERLASVAPHPSDPTDRR